MSIDRRNLVESCPCSLTGRRIYRAGFGFVIGFTDSTAQAGSGVRSCAGNVLGSPLKWAASRCQRKSRSD